jgi:hypothetical protein
MADIKDERMVVLALAGLKLGCAQENINFMDCVEKALEEDLTEKQVLDEMEELEHEMYEDWQEEHQQGEADES